MNKLGLGANHRLGVLNQRSAAENLAKSSFIVLSICGLSLVYFILALSLFHSLWYHKLFAAASALMFGYSMYDLYFEYIEQKIKKSLPKTTKKLSHYYTHFRGNVIPAIRETEEKCGPESQLYLFKIRKALLAGNPKEETEQLKKSFPFVWYRMLASVLYMAKEKGLGAEVTCLVKTLTKLPIFSALSIFSRAITMQSLSIYSFFFTFHRFSLYLPLIGSMPEY